MTKLAAVAMTIGLVAMTPLDNAVSLFDWDLGWIEANCTQSHPCYSGNTPSYDNPNCWPGAIFCPVHIFGNDES